MTPISTRESRILTAALKKRESLLTDRKTTAYRLLSGSFEGLPGVFVDRYGDVAVMMVYQGEVSSYFEPRAFAELLINRLDLKAVYLKHFIPDRSRSRKKIDERLYDPSPIVGEPVPEAITILENGLKFEVHMYDGFSTGLFLDQRVNRAALAERARGKRVLNMFSYTCGFSVYCAAAGSTVTSVDVSSRYLDWGKHNFQLNDIDPDEHYFARMDAFDFLGMGERRGFRYDLIILDPPSFSAGKKGKSFSIKRDYPRLLREANKLLASGGFIFASTNNSALAQGDVFDDMIEKAFRGHLQRRRLPKVPVDFASEKNRMICRLYG